MPGASRGRRRLRAALLAAALAFGVVAPATAMTTAAPALTAGGGSWDDNGPDDGGSGNIGGSTGVSNGFKCDGKYLVTSKGRAYDNPYPNCDPATNAWTWKRTGDIRLCPVGFQVFRFYGSYTQPVSAYTVSDVQLTNWCSYESAYSFWALSPADATGKSPGVPWYARQENNPMGQYVGGGHFSAVGRTEFGRLSAGVPYSTSGACTTAQTTPNPIADYLANPEVTAASKKATRQLFYNTYLSLSRNGKYPRTALAVLGLSSISRNADTGTVSMRFDKRACSSPMDYISTADETKLVSSATERSKFKVTGTCYIPVDRMAYKLTSGSKTLWGFPSLKGPWGAGLRYSQFYKGTAYTAASPRGAQGEAPNAWEKNVLAKWRSAMSSWYAAQPTYTSIHQSLPVAPYKLNAKGNPTGETQTADRGTARTTLRDMSRCRFGSQVAFKTTATGATPPATMALTMENRELFQAGGMNRIQDVVIRRGPVRCTASAAICATANVQLTKLKYNVSVTSTEPTKYSACTTTSTAGCDYKVLDITPRTTGAIQPDTTIRVVFFNPTMSTQKLKIAISGVSAQYQYQAKVGGLDLELEDPISGQPVDFKSSGGTTPVVKPLPVTVTGDPVPLVTTGGVHTYQAPVIGAVDRSVD